MPHSDAFMSAQFAKPTSPNIRLISRTAAIDLFGIGTRLPQRPSARWVSNWRRFHAFAPCLRQKRNCTENAYCSCAEFKRITLGKNDASRRWRSTGMHVRQLKLIGCRQVKKSRRSRGPSAPAIAGCGCVRMASKLILCPDRSHSNVQVVGRKMRWLAGNVVMPKTAGLGRQRQTSSSSVKEIKAQSRFGWLPSLQRCRWPSVPMLARRDSDYAISSAAIPRSAAFPGVCPPILTDRCLAFAKALFINRRVAPACRNWPIWSLPRPSPGPPRRLQGLRESCRRQ